MSEVRRKTWLPFWNRSRSSSRFRHSANFEGVLGTSLELQIVGNAPEVGPRAEGEALAEIDRLATIFNAYNPASEFSRWQQSQGEDVEVSAELAHSLQVSEEWRIKTLGTFNPATEALTRLWTAAARQLELPTDADLSALLRQLNAPLWSVTPGTHPTARRLTALPATLNSLAKGQIIDAACERAASYEGVLEVLVNIGGDLRHKGQQELRVAVANPFDSAENSAPVAWVRINNRGLATSGNYRRGFQVGEQWYSHLLDPRTGRPVEHVVSASVIAPDAATADVLATAFSVLKPSESLELAESLPEIGMLLISEEGTQISNSAWHRYVEAEAGLVIPA